MTNIVGVGVHFNGLVLLASDLNRSSDMGLTNLCVHRRLARRGKIRFPPRLRGGRLVGFLITQLHIKLILQYLA
jgi:hypothetical protein